MKIYIVLTQTGTTLSKVLEHITKDEYNHASISLDEELNHMYSFGRRHAYNPFWAGFIKEHPSQGTFKRFKNASAKIISVDINEDDYFIVKTYLENMYKNKYNYKYNFKGLIFAAKDKVYIKENHYYCSEFVREILRKANAVDSYEFDGIVKPVDFLNIKNHEEVYVGNLHKYNAQLNYK